ncbi:MAG: DUF4435 domain-containing protein [Symploca sp. SIO2E9]|nr:DUF4435 domain-containing protein [Symploca sp. SIO2E9]
MREFLTPERIANTIKMQRSSFLGTFILVEGSSDKLFYKRFVDDKDCRLETTAGKPSSKLQAIKVLEILNKSSFKGVLAIVDADFDHLETSLNKIPNLLRTDTHDIETMLINSPALDKVLAEFGSQDKITNFGRDIREILLEAGLSIGYLLRISQSDGLSLTFNGIKFSKFINEQTLQIDELKLIEEVKNKSQFFSLEDEELQKKLTYQKNNNYDPWQVCCGHDLVEILSIGLRKAIGSCKAADIEPNSLERSLRLAYEEAYFHKTQLYSDICQWQINNQPFKVLPSYT